MNNNNNLFSPFAHYISRYIFFVLSLFLFYFSHTGRIFITG